MSIRRDQIIGVNEEQASNDTGHTVFGIKEEVNFVDSDVTKRIVYKKNKHGNANASSKEVAFGEVARVCIDPGLTPKTHLVKNDDGVQGVAVEFAQHAIDHYASHETHRFYSINADERGKHTANPVPTPETLDIPFEFLQDKPHGFFADLMDYYQHGDIDIDMDSLASVLAGSYFLEEDDLHKGNIGYFVIKGPGEDKLKVVFFKIDHDLMFMNSIMSYSDSRIANAHYHSNSFDFTQEDLNNFPDIKHGAHYWVTQKRTLVPGGDDAKKVYNDTRELRAFANLKNNPAFVRAKWRNLLKYTLIQKKQIERTLCLHLDLSNDEDRIIFNEVVDATMKRSAQLRAHLISNPEFREYCKTHGVEDFARISDDINQSLIECLPAGYDETDNTETRTNVAHEFGAMLMVCQQSDRKDTQLHTAIRLGKYRLKESAELFKRDINTRNFTGEKPLDVVYHRIKQIEEDLAAIRELLGNPEFKDNFKQNTAEKKRLKQELQYSNDMLADLYQHGAKPGLRLTEQYVSANKKYLKEYNPNPYRTSKISNYHEVRSHIHVICADDSLTVTLKQRFAKELILSSLGRLAVGDLFQLRDALTYMREHSQTKNLEFQFLCQTEHTYYISRMRKGQYSYTPVLRDLQQAVTQMIRQKVEAEKAPVTCTTTTVVNKPLSMDDFEVVVDTDTHGVIDLQRIESNFVMLLQMKLPGFDDNVTGLQKQLIGLVKTHHDMTSFTEYLATNPTLNTLIDTHTGFSVFGGKTDARAEIEAILHPQATATTCCIVGFRG